MVRREGTGPSDGLSCSDLFHRAFRITLPDRRELWIGDIHGDFFARLYALIVYDPVDQRVTREPRLISARGMEAGFDGLVLAPPVVSFADLYGDGGFQIVFTRRFRVGTSATGIRRHHFDVSADLALKPVLALRSREPGLDFETEFLVREVTPLALGLLRLDLFNDPGGDRRRRQSMGYALLGSPGRGEPFKLLERQPLGADASGDPPAMGVDEVQPTVDVID